MIFKEEMDASHSGKQRRSSMRDVKVREMYCSVGKRNPILILISFLKFIVCVV